MDVTVETTMYFGFNYFHRFVPESNLISFFFVIGVKCCSEEICWREVLGLSELSWRASFDLCAVQILLSIQLVSFVHLVSKEVVSEAEDRQNEN